MAAIVRVVEDSSVEDLSEVMAVDCVARFDDLTVALVEDLDEELFGRDVLEGEGGLATEVAGNGDVLPGWSLA